jgi:hypothetical protein
MNALISQERINYIKADLEQYGKPFICRKLGINVATVVDLQLENSNNFSSNFIHLLSLDNTSLKYIFNLKTLIDIDPKKINTFDYFIQQNNFLDDLQSRIKNKCDFVIKVSVRCREYCSDGTYNESDNMGSEYFWFTGSSYENALLLALAFVSDYHENHNPEKINYFKAMPNKKAIAIAPPKPMMENILLTAKKIFLSPKT